ncbi:preprotein translocase subunit SecD [Orrella sp. JC864]|uniref:SecDF P1 head subdomain-containing protein n=1 Tax=Orrella sp. JC864 TaxID=3120298 RepID=UPI003008F075
MQISARTVAPLAALAFVLAGCQTSGDKTASQTEGAPPAASASQPGQLAPGAVDPAQAAAPSVAFYIAQTEADPALMEVPLRDGSLYVQRTPALTRDDLAEAAAMVDQAGQNFVGLRFTEAGARKLTEVSSRNVGQRLALVVDRELIAAPRIAEPLDRGVLAFATPNAQAAAEIAAAIRGDDPSSAGPAPGGEAAPAAAPAPAVPAQSGQGEPGGTAPPRM